MVEAVLATTPDNLISIPEFTGEPTPSDVHTQASRTLTQIKKKVKANNFEVGSARGRRRRSRVCQLALTPELRPHSLPLGPEVEGAAGVGRRSDPALLSEVQAG